MNAILLYIIIDATYGGCGSTNVGIPRGASDAADRMRHEGSHRERQGKRPPGGRPGRIR